MIGQPPDFIMCCVLAAGHPACALYRMCPSNACRACIRLPAFLTLLPGCPGRGCHTRVCLTYCVCLTFCLLCLYMPSCLFYSAARVSWAGLELRCGNLDAARQLLREGLDQHPDYPAALLLTAQLERRSGNLNLAEAYARRAQKVGSEGLCAGFSC